MISETHVEGVVEAVKQWKLRDFQMGNRDSLPQLGFMPDGADAYEAVPQWVMLDAIEKASGNTALALHMVLYSIPKNFPDVTKFRALTFIADGYTATRQKGDPFPDESLEEEFKTNPATDVVECVTVLMADDDLVGGVDLAIAQIPYVIGDGGVMTFGDADIHIDADDHKVKGTIADIVRDVWKRQSC